MKKLSPLLPPTIRTLFPSTRTVVPLARTVVPSTRTIAVLFTFLFALSCSGGGGGDDGGTTLSNNACSQLNLNTRVINGATCSEAGSPVVEIDILFANSTVGLCSGTLLTPTYVLTAAHCFFGRSVSAAVQVDGRIVSAKRFISHPNVAVDEQNRVVLNDAALVELNEPLSSQQTLPLLLSRSVQSGDTISVFGYGQDEKGNSGVLESGEMRVSDVTPNHISARFDGQGSNPCFGDSGGPAVLSFINENGVDVDAVAGIVSSGELITCLEGDRTLFTNATGDSVANWIVQNVPGLSIQ